MKRSRRYTHNGRSEILRCDPQTGGHRKKHEDKKYTFLVHPEANKAQIREAVEKMFDGTKVKSVNTMNIGGKTKRRGMVFGKTAKTKKAIVTLTEDSKDIEIFAGL